MTRPTYDDETKAKALELYVEVGPAEASRKTGIKAGTIRQWAFRSDEDLVAVTSEKMRAAVTAARERKLLTTEQFRARMIDLLTEIAELGGCEELRVLAEENPSLEKIVGARTRAIHDIQLLSGAATGRVEYTGRDELDSELKGLVAALADNDPATDDLAVRANGNGHGKLSE